MSQDWTTTDRLKESQNGKLSKGDNLEEMDG